jgi:hypothetical protein
MKGLSVPIRGLALGVLVLLCEASLTTAAIPKEFVSLKATFRLKDDPGGKAGGVVDAMLVCSDGQCTLSEIVLTGCSSVEPRGFNVFSHTTADDGTKHSFQGVTNRDGHGGWITAEYEQPGLHRTSYRFDYLKEKQGFVLTGASKIDFTYKSVVTGRPETLEWVPLTGLEPIVNLGCGFKATGIPEKGKTR